MPRRRKRTLKLPSNLTIDMSKIPPEELEKARAFVARPPTYDVAIEVQPQPPDEIAVTLEGTVDENGLFTGKLVTFDPSAGDDWTVVQIMRDGKVIDQIRVPRKDANDAETT